MKNFTINLIVNPYMESIANEVEKVISKLHSENYALNDEDELSLDTTPTLKSKSADVNFEGNSLFLIELRNVIEAIKKQHFDRFLDGSFKSTGMEYLASWLIRCYCSHASLIRPISENGKMKINEVVGITEEQFEKLAEKKDACYHKVKARYKVWPSAYASGALVQCRKKGAANWGNKSKK